MKELKELKAAFKDLQLISERNLFMIQLGHKIGALEEVLIKHNLSVPFSRPDGADGCPQDCSFKYGSTICHDCPSYSGG